MLKASKISLFDIHTAISVACEDDASGTEH